MMISLTIPPPTDEIKLIAKTPVILKLLSSAAIAPEIENEANPKESLIIKKSLFSSLFCLYNLKISINKITKITNIIGA